MATAGFNVSDELKQRVDKAAEQFVNDNGGSKADFLTAMLSAWETGAARLALPGRADDIDDFESHMASLKASYIQSLSIAKSAREDADVAVKAEIQKAQGKQAELVATINDLRSRLKDAEAEKKEIESKAAVEVANSAKTFNAELDKVRAKAEEADAAKAEAINAKADLERLRKELADSKNELEQQTGRYKEKMDVAKEKADIELRKAVLEAKEMASKEIDALRTDYAKKLRELTVTGNVTKEQLVQWLTMLVRDRTKKGWTLGLRSETDEMDTQVRSKAVRAYIVDLFGNYDEVHGLKELESAIADSIQ